ncbi:hypothetical protein [Streptomyces tagetis]|uniref:Uncharacterized protein n=1 Tax=Streptomyces tagetis TaxID=2820809 RepID=A0A941AYP0_9ACTN|nr:hypothetical protein [Streptomyces sp. RG38]MBQ0825265.1 hypothetical protein [Streptomyces sp. RG38]
MTITVRDNPEQSRDEIRDGRTPAGLPVHGITGRRTEAVRAAVCPQPPAPARVSG